MPFPKGSFFKVAPIIRTVTYGGLAADVHVLALRGLAYGFRGSGERGNKKPQTTETLLGPFVSGFTEFVG